MAVVFVAYGARRSLCFVPPSAPSQTGLFSSTVPRPLRPILLRFLREQGGFGTRDLEPMCCAAGAAQRAHSTRHNSQPACGTAVNYRGQVGIVLVIAISTSAPRRILLGHAHSPMTSLLSLKTAYFSPAINRAIYFD